MLLAPAAFQRGTAKNNRGGGEKLRGKGVYARFLSSNSPWVCAVKQLVCVRTCVLVVFTRMGGRPKLYE